MIAGRRTSRRDDHDQAALADRSPSLAAAAAPSPAPAAPVGGSAHADGAAHGVDAVPDDRDAARLDRQARRRRRQPRRRRPSTSPSTACPTGGRRRCAAAASSSSRSRRRPTTPATATLEIDVPAGRPPPGRTRSRSPARDGAATVDGRPSRSTSPQQVDNGIQITADFPSLKGDAGDGVLLQPHRHQQHAGGADVHVRPDGAAGLDGDRLADRRGQRPDGDDRRRRRQHGQGRRHPAGTGRPGPVPDRRRRDGGQRAHGQDRADGRGHRRAEAGAATADQRLDASGTPTASSGCR